LLADDVVNAPVGVVGADKTLGPLDDNDLFRGAGLQCLLQLGGEPLLQAFGFDVQAGRDVKDLLGIQKAFLLQATQFWLQDCAGHQTMVPEGLFLFHTQSPRVLTSRHSAA
jgi:hypothetical protein